MQKTKEKGKKMESETKLIISLIFFLFIVSCGKSETKKPSAIQLPKINYEQVVLASGKIKKGQIYVKNSVPVIPGTKVDLIDWNSSPKKAIVRNVPLISVKWKVPGPFQTPKYPASGFVELTLSENQWKAIKAKKNSIFVLPTVKTKGTE